MTHTTTAYIGQHIHFESATTLADGVPSYSLEWYDPTCPARGGALHCLTGQQVKDLIHALRKLPIGCERCGADPCVCQRLAPFAPTQEVVNADCVVS